MLDQERRMPGSADPEATAGVGGKTFGFNSVVALKYGDVVSASGVQGVTKTNVAADALKFVGVVVGGGSPSGGYDYPNWDTAPALAGTQASAINQAALVQTDGIANVVAGAAVAAGAAVGLDTGTAGRVITNATGGQVIGIALTAAAGPGSVFQILIARR